MSYPRHTPLESYGERVFTAVSLFAGAGGLDMGMERAGFRTIWANDIFREACETYRMRSQATVVCADIAKVDVNDIPASDIILGGFPCQGFSVSGPRRVHDVRNSLYKHYVRIVREKQPLLFVGENVKGILTMDNGRVIEAIIEEFASCGYNVRYRLINAKQYGIAQDRERVIITGFRKDLGELNFDISPRNYHRVTLRDIIGKMPPPAPDEVCDAPFSSRYMSRNRKRGWDEVSFTIPAMAKQVSLHPGSPDMVKIGKDLWRFGEGAQTRRLSWKEAAVIQTFPADMKFAGDLTNIYKQIGNAVPVKLAEYVGHKLYDILISKRQ